jgi:hypothetical protein
MEVRPLEGGRRWASGFVGGMLVARSLQHSAHPQGSHMLHLPNVALQDLTPGLCGIARPDPWIRPPNYGWGVRRYAGPGTEQDSGPRSRARFDPKYCLRELTENQGVFGLGESADHLADRSILLIGWSDTFSHTPSRSA